MNGLALVALALLLIAATTNGTSLPEAKSLHRTDPLPEVGLDVVRFVVIISCIVGECYCFRKTI